MASKNPTDDFVKLWTLKESYVKCIGTGIADNLSGYDFSSVAQNYTDKFGDYSLSVLDLGECFASVCSFAPTKQIKKISIVELEYFCKNIR